MITPFRAALRVAVLTAISAGMFVGCGKPADQPAPPPPEVSVATVPEREITEWDEYTGRLEAVDTVEIRPQVSGYLQRVVFDEGAAVKKGQLLFQIDPRPFQAELDGALAQAEIARTQAELAGSDLARAEKLLETRAFSREEYEQRVAARSNALAQVKAAEAAVRTARLNLDYTRVTSPIDGRVGRAEVTQGNLVSGGQGGQATRLTTVVSQAPMYAYFEASEQDYLKYLDLARSGQRETSIYAKNPVQMAVGNETEFKHEGYMDFVDNRVDTGTGTLMGRAVFPNPDRYLAPGMFVRVRLIGSGKYKGGLVTDRAISTDQDRRFVLVVGEGNQIEYRAIETGPIVDGLRVIRSGLKPGERVVVNGLQRVRPGMVVTPKEVPMDPAEAAETPAPAPAVAGQG
jgi:RND family efflux transporter MFP subunit